MIRVIDEPSVRSGGRTAARPSANCCGSPVPSDVSWIAPANRVCPCPFERDGRDEGSPTWRRSAAWKPYRRGAELLFQVLTEPEERSAVSIASNEPFDSRTKTFTDPRLCVATVDRLTFRRSDRRDPQIVIPARARPLRAPRTLNSGPVRRPTDLMLRTTMAESFLRRPDRRRRADRCVVSRPNGVAHRQPRRALPT